MRGEKVKEYDIVKATRTEELSKYVQEYIDDGWCVWGPLIDSDMFYYQAVVKYHSPLDTP